MDNLGAARLLSETADLMELGQENPFKVRAYRNAAQLVAALPGPIAKMSPEAIRALPGVGKDISARLDEILRTGTTRLLDELRAKNPVSLLDLKRLPGIGPRTLIMLWQDMGIASPSDLERAIREGRLRTVRGFGPKKEAALLKALAARHSVVARHLLPDCRERAEAFCGWLSERVAGARVSIAGGIRRGVELCTGIDIVAAGTPKQRAQLGDAFRAYSLVESVEQAGDGLTARLWGGMDARLVLVDRKAFGLALIQHTGADAHVDALRALAAHREVTPAGAEEEDVYKALGLAWIPPELREGHDELDLAARGGLPSLIDLRDLRGDLHMHTTASDGKVDVEGMAAAARDAGLEYIVITDHSNALPMVNGLDNQRALEHAGRIRAVDRTIAGIRVLAGVECDILADGRMDLADEVLRELDFVIGSPHAALTQSPADATARLLRAIENPWVDMIGHPTGRKLLRRDGLAPDIDRVLDAAKEHGVAMEINGQADRLDLRPEHARKAKERGILIAIDSDGHSPRGLALKQWAVIMARRAGITPKDCLNARPFDKFRAAIRRSRYTQARTP